jgi:single-strand DNA-binding protein
MLPAVSMECRAVADPELRFGASGIAVSKIRTVSSRRKKNDAGEWVDDKTCWLDVTCFGKLAENVAESVAKGDQLVITGSLQTDEWNDKETGEKRSKIECIAWTVSVSLAFRTVKHGEGRAERQTQRQAVPSGGDPWATPVGQSEEPPF